MQTSRIQHAECKSSKDLLKSFKQVLASETQQLYADFEAGHKVEDLILSRSNLIDQLLTDVWHYFFGTELQGLGLIAVGGFGRRELLPQSDIDLLILGDEEAINGNTEKLENLITFLWDTNLEIGHSVRTVDECLEQARADITIVTNLMESRTIVGDTSLHKKLKPMISPQNIWPSKDFFQAKWDEQITRHKKYNNTEYNLEPNIKSCQGGLRDIQMIGWVAKRHFGASSIDDLLANGFLTAEEYEIMINGQSFLLKLRFALHMISGREEDRLLFEYQTQIYRFFGYEDNTGNLAVEQMMKQYYRWVLALSELNEMIMQFFDETILRACDAEEVMEINSRFRVRNNHIEVTNNRVFEQFPYALLEIFYLIATYDNITHTRAATIRLIREHRHTIDDDFRDDPRNKQIFKDILRSPRRVASTLIEMKRFGILGKYLPAFGDIIGQSQFDLFHIYTVDSHTLNVLKYMRRFTYEDMREEYPIASQVMKRIEDRDLLYIACLFHDIAKGRGGNHAILGAEDAFEFCRSHGYNYRDSNMVAWLVKNHLLMSFTSQKRDISDPDVIKEFALTIGDQMHLDYLFVLTVADINGTNPELWNAWRASLLRQLYYDTKRAMRRGLEKFIDRHEIVEECMQHALEKLKKTGVNMDHAKLILDNADEDYFLRENPADIAWQTEAIVGKIDNNAPLILVKDSSDRIFNDATQIFIHTKGDRYTFALVVSALEQLYLNIVDARIYSSASGYTLDTFFVLDANDEPLKLNDGLIAKIRKVITSFLASHEEFSSIASRRTPRQLKFFTIPTSTNITHDKQKGHSVLEVTTADRPGLLARIADIFVENDIELINAKISTLGEKVEDVFFICDQNHKPLYDKALCKKIQQAIIQQLDEQVAQTS